VTTRFRFALTRADPDGKPFHIGVQRAAQEIVIDVQPRRMSGGYEVTYRADPDRSAAFFASPK
jgi:hypothetical protein